MFRQLPASDSLLSTAAVPLAEHQIICCCDIALADDSALFCLSDVKLGLVPATIGPVNRNGALDNQDATC